MERLSIPEAIAFNRHFAEPRLGVWPPQPKVRCLAPTPETERSRHLEANRSGRATSAPFVDANILDPLFDGQLDDGGFASIGSPVAGPVSVRVSVFVCGTRIANRVALTHARAAHASRDTRTEHAHAHGHRGSVSA